MEIIVVKRDGTEEMYEESKVSESIMAAAIEVGGEDYDLADDLAEMITDLLVTNDIKSVTSAELEVLIRNMLIDEGHSSTATRYIEFAAARNKQREMDSALMHSYEEITFQSGEESDMKRENANIKSESSMGVMLKYGSEGAKKFNLNFVIDPKISKYHIDGDIHIHDLDFYTLTQTCCQIDIGKLFKGGFNTGHGFLREHGNIRSAGALAAIAIQSNQNDQHRRVAA